MRDVPVTMYMTTWCPVCQRARGWLETGGYNFMEFDVDSNPRAGRILRSLNPRGTIPADEGLLAMRRVIRRLYGDEQKAQNVARI